MHASCHAKANETQSAKAEGAKCRRLVIVVEHCKARRRTRPRSMPSYAIEISRRRPTQRLTGRKRSIACLASPRTEEMSSRTCPRPCAASPETDAPSCDARGAWSKCAAALNRMCAAAPFGDAPSASEPPYSAKQLLAWGQSLVLARDDGMWDDGMDDICAPQFAASRLPSSAELQIATNDTLLLIEAFNRSRLEQQLSSLQHATSDSASSQSLVSSLAPHIKDLMLRHGHEAIAQQLRALPSPNGNASSIPSTEAVDALFAPLSRFACRVASWQQLLCQEGVPNVVASQMRALGKRSLYAWPCPQCPWLTGSICTSLQTGDCVSLATALASSPTMHVQLEVRLAYTPTATVHATAADDYPAQNVHRIFVSETMPGEKLHTHASKDGSEGTGSAPAEEAAAEDEDKPPYVGPDAATVQQAIEYIGSHAIVFDPPVGLRRPGDFMVCAPLRKCTNGLGLDAVP